MPKQLENKLKREYAKLPKKQRDRAVYGTMNKIEKAKRRKAKAKRRSK